MCWPCAKCLACMNPLGPRSHPTEESPSYQGFPASAESLSGSVSWNPGHCSSPDSASVTVIGAQVQKEAGALFSSGA